MSAASKLRARGSGLVTAWRNFWFQPQAAYTLGVVRIAFGALVLCWTLLLSSGLYTAFGDAGVLPKPPAREFTWGVFHTYSSDNALLIGWGILLAAAVALMVGWHSRLAAFLVFVLILSFERANPLIFNAGDTVIRIEALFLALAPCGAALSLDQRRRTGSFWTAQEIRPWPLRLLQIQLSIIYLSTVVAKLAGQTWQNGTAVAYSLRQRDMLVFQPPGWLLDNLLIANVLTWGTLTIEVAIGVLVWKRKWRPWVLAMGVMLHLSISFFLDVGFFSVAMFVLYLAFVPPERVQALVVRIQMRTSAVTARFRRQDDTDEEDIAQPMTVDRIDETDVCVAERDEQVVVNRREVLEHAPAPRQSANTAVDGWPDVNGRAVRQPVPASRRADGAATNGRPPANGHAAPFSVPTPRRDEGVVAKGPPSNGHAAHHPQPAPRHTGTENGRPGVNGHGVREPMPERRGDPPSNEGSATGSHRMHEPPPLSKRAFAASQLIDNVPSGRHARRSNGTNDSHDFH
jgi:hypothetical protein